MKCKTLWYPMSWSLLKSDDKKGGSVHFAQVHAMAGGPSRRPSPPEASTSLMCIATNPWASAVPLLAANVATSVSLRPLHPAWWIHHDLLHHITAYYSILHHYIILHDVSSWCWHQFAASSPLIHLPPFNLLSWVWDISLKLCPYLSVSCLRRRRCRRWLCSGRFFADQHWSHPWRPALWSLNLSTCSQYPLVN